MNLTNSEKLILIMLSEIYEKLDMDGQNGIDPGFIKEAIYSDNTWGFEWKYTGIFHASDPIPPEVNDVTNILDMWTFMEEAFEVLDDEGRIALELLAPPFGKDLKFPGFDGNNECEYISITRFLTDQLDRFTRFKGRNLNSHMPSVSGYRRMYEAFEPIRRTMIGRMLSVNELGKILNARR